MSRRSSMLDADPVGKQRVQRSVAHAGQARGVAENAFGARITYEELIA